MSTRTHEFDIQLSVVHVSNLKRSVAMPGCFRIQFPIKGLYLIPDLCTEFGLVGDWPLNFGPRSFLPDWVRDVD